jgi:hypothetical protein
VEVNPADVKPEDRELIAQRMEGIDVKSVELEFDSFTDEPEVSRGELIVVQGVSLDDLITAVKKENATLAARVEKHLKETEDKRAFAESLKVPKIKRATPPPATLKPPYRLPN